MLVKTALVFHYGLFHDGLARLWAHTYALLRLKAGLGPVAAGLASGAAMSVIVDEGLTPSPGFSAPHRDYPLTTHARGVTAHLTFDLAVAAVTEAAWACLRRRL